MIAVDSDSLSYAYLGPSQGLRLGIGWVHTFSDPDQLPGRGRDHSMVDLAKEL